MEGKIRLPYYKQDESFSAKEISSDDYIKMLHSAYDGTFFDGYDFGKSTKRDYLDKKYGISDIQKIEIEEKYNSFYDIDCKIFDISGKDLSEDMLNLYIFKKNMFILKLDIDNIEPDAESELKYWVRDSMNINSHKEIPEKKKILMLPDKNLILNNKNKENKLIGCKIVDFESPFRITLLIKQII